PWNGLGNLFTDHLGQYAEAEEAYRRAIALDEKDASPWSGLGNLLSDQTRFAEAEEAYRRAIALDEKDAFPWNGLGTLLMSHLGRYAEAEEAYRRAIALDEKNAYPWGGLGVLLADHLGRYAEAEEAYRKAIALDEKKAAIWNNLGNLLTGYLGRYAEAEDAYRRAIALDEKDAGPWNSLGILFSRLGRHADAETAYYKAMEVNSENADYPQSVAEMALVRGELDKAFTMLERAKGLCKTDVNQQNQAMLELALALAWDDRAAVTQSVRQLSQWQADQRPTSQWNYDDIKPLLERLPEKSRHLFQEWVRAVKREPGADPEGAFEKYLEGLKSPST
ncbi:MAG: tetratricopeptide repeat protein, partial [Magnetococcales bacterium]|nr:tetratricopeptide repeat protein [Magnetococcales bacterium]